MDDLRADKGFIEQCLKSFNQREMKFFREYRERLLKNGFLEVEDAEEAACHRVINERGAKL